MKRQGKITLKTGQELEKRLPPRGYKVIYDHGENTGTGVGSISSWIGDDIKRVNKLAEIDIAIIYKKTGQTLLLVEIEESGNDPKRLIGDVMATLIGDGISLRKRQKLKIGKRTTLLILLKITKKGHTERIDAIKERIKTLTRKPICKNMRIRETKIEQFQLTTDPLVIIMKQLNIPMEIGD